MHSAEEADVYKRQEYDRDIQKEYGIFLLKGDDAALSKKLRRYLEYSFKNMKDVDIEAAEVSGSRFSTSNIDPVKEQILEYMELAVAEDGFGMWKGGTERDEDESITESRSLRHGPTAVSLPSASLPDKSLTALAESLASDIKEIDKAFEKGTDTYLLNRYIPVSYTHLAAGLSRCRPTSSGWRYSRLTLRYLSS